MSSNTNKKPSVIFVNDTSCENHYGCVTVVKNLCNIIIDAGFDICYRVATNDLQNLKDITSKIAHCDLIVINGEGTIHSDRPKAYLLMAWAQYAKDNNIKFILVNSTWHNNSSELAYALNKSEFIYVREEVSRLELLKCNINSEVMPDAVLSSEVNSAINSNIVSSNAKVLFTDSVLPRITLELEKLRKEQKADIVSMFYSNNFFEYWQDRFKLLPKKKLIKEPWLIIGMLFFYQRQYISITKNFIDFEKQVTNSKFIVTGRFHMVCFALLWRIPFYTVESNTSKISSLLSGVGIEDRCFQDVYSLKNKIEKDGYIEFSAEEKDKVESFMRNIQNKYNDFQNKLHSIAIKADNK